MKSTALSWSSLIAKTWKYWYAKAAKQGVTKAQRLLAVSLYKANTGQIKFSESYAWMKIAADSGNSEAIELLAYIEENLSDTELKRGLAFYKQCMKTGLIDCPY